VKAAADGLVGHLEFGPCLGAARQRHLGKSDHDAVPSRLAQSRAKAPPPVSSTK
jgi:hypothetical protein